MLAHGCKILALSTLSGDQSGALFRDGPIRVIIQATGGLADS